MAAEQGDEQKKKLQSLAVRDCRAWSGGVSVSWLCKQIMAMVI